MMVKSAHTSTNGKDSMTQFYGSFYRLAGGFLFLALLTAIMSGGTSWRVKAQAVPDLVGANGDSSLVEGFKRVEVASVSDAMEQLLGKKMYMSHHMQPIFPSRFAGFALTVRLKKDEGNHDPMALNGMLAAIDRAAMNSVYVM